MLILQWAGTLADDCKLLHDEEVEKRHKFSGRLSEYTSTFMGLTIQGVNKLYVNIFHCDPDGLSDW